MYRISRYTTWKLAAGALLLMGVPVLFFACGRTPSSARTNSASGVATKSNAAAGAGPRVETVTVEPRDLAKTVEMPGTVEGFETADLYAKVGGYLEEFREDSETGGPIDIGSLVQKGQELARLYIPEMDKQLQQKQAAVGQAEAELRQAEAVIDQAQADLESARAARDEAETEKAEKQAELDFRRVSYDRMKRLADSGSLQRELADEAKYQLDAAEAAMATVAARIRTAEAKLRGAQAHLEKVKADHNTAEARLKAAQADADYVETLMQYAVIRSPYDGIVTRRWVHPGAFIQPADGNSAAKPLLTVTRTDRIRISLDIPMNDVRLLDRGDRAIMNRINVLPGEQFEGQVSRLSSSLDTQSRMMRVEVDLPNPDGRLLPGYYGYVTVYLEELNDTPVIPSSALLTEGDEQYVYCCENGRARKRVVTTNYQDGTWVGIASGLEGGEQVVRAGGGQIQDGTPVDPVLTEAGEKVES